MLLFYLLIVFVCSGECSRNQREEYPTGGAGESKMRFKRAIGGRWHYRAYYEDGTLWSDRVRHHDAFADSRFYGQGLIVHKRFILAQKDPLLAAIYEENKVNFWDRHVQFGDKSTKDYYTGEINVKEGVRRKDGHRGRKFGLRYVGDATNWFGLAERLNQWNDSEEFDFKQRYMLKDKDAPARDCKYIGWSQQYQNGVKKADTRYFVFFPVEIRSCSDHVCQFLKSDGPGGFCNTYQESGGIIWCMVDHKDPGSVHYIVVQDPKRPKMANCSGLASAYHVPYLMDAVKKVLKPAGDDNDKGGHVELALE